MVDKDNSRLYLALGLLGAAALAYASKGAVTNVIDQVELTMSDLRTQKIIEGLHPAMRSAVVDLIRNARLKGIFLAATSGLRTFDEQQKLYNQGRTTPGNIVTYAKPGDSFHNYGLAVDVVPIVNGKADYNTKRWNEIGAIGKALGFRWGGDFKNIVDRPHFEKSYGLSLAQLKARYSAGQRKGIYVYLA